VASEHAPALAVRDRWDGRVATVTVLGELDISTVDILSHALDKLARQSPERLVVDMAGVGFMDSSGLHAFVRVRKVLPAGCPIVVRSPQRGVRQVFQLTGMTSVLTFE
jgi:anti-anti-sigma factor